MRIIHRTLIGHSFGGLFTVNAVLTQPHAFDDFIAADPSFWWDQRRLIQKAAADGLGDKAAAGPGRPARRGGSIPALPQSRARTAPAVLSGRQRGLACQQIHWSQTLLANFSLKACRCADRISQMRCTEPLCSQPCLML
ncbi:putative uncharacterized protein [Sutterella wadsworthensis CAG:135]|nr:putative uncharacterized protein [Sutterella wadsworthensis CAG:135]